MPLVLVTMKIDAFVSQGFPVDQRNNQSYTALMVAAYQGNRETVELFVSIRVPMLACKTNVETPLWWEHWLNAKSVLRHLVPSECSPELRNKAGLNLKEFAEIYGQSNAEIPSH